MNPWNAQKCSRFILTNEKMVSVAASGIMTAVFVITLDHSNTWAKQSLDGAALEAAEGLRWRRFWVINCAPRAQLSVTSLFEKAQYLGTSISVLDCGVNLKDPPMHHYDRIVVLGRVPGQFWTLLDSPVKPAWKLLLVLQGQDEGFHQKLQAYNYSRGFYEYHTDSGTAYEVMTFHDSDLVLRLEMERDRQGQLLHTDDMQAAPIRAVGKEYRPWLTVTDCDEKGRNCLYDMLLKDLVIELTHRFNFSLFLDEEPSGLWGIRADASDYYKENTTFGGVLGSVYGPRYDLSLCGWFYLLERTMKFHMTWPILSEPSMAVINRQKLGLDSSFFARPLTAELWALISVTMSVLGLIILGQFSLEKILPQFSTEQSRKIVLTSGESITALFFSSLSCLFLLLHQ